MSKSDANEVAAAKTKLTHVRKELDATEERFATGKIETALYNKFSEKYKNEILELEEKLLNPNLTSSNLEKCKKMDSNCRKTSVKYGNLGVCFINTNYNFCYSLMALLMTSKKAEFKLLERMYFLI
jgi:hypothetical protein